MRMTTVPAAGNPGIPRSLYVLSVFYGGMVCLAGVLGNKQVSIGLLAVEAGIFAFLLLVVVSSAIAELHGRDTANSLVKFGFIPLLFAMALSWIVYALPASPDMAPENAAAIQLILGATGRIWAAGVCAYGVSQFLNVYIFSKLQNMPGRWLAVRGVIASALSQIVDTLIFVTIAFYGVFPIGQLLVGQMAAKVALSVALVPFLIVFFVRLGKRLDA
ncbi:transporter [Blastomonas aquatica]|uniref:Probable queuosine precursor transporter n=2 Tax=Blastomonas aquatica TaxID=1510276 RepID=A0ABQ1JMN2_9SPHN|nr:transporter [Blastomonas aquatica]